MPKADVLVVGASEGVPRQPRATLVVTGAGMKCLDVAPRDLQIFATATRLWRRR
jgi:hypothetical protein